MVFGGEGSGRSARRWGALVLTMALVAAACGDGNGDDAAEPADETRTVHLNALFFRGPLPDGSFEGGAGPVRIRVSPFEGEELRVGFTEDEVAGTGDMWRAAGWQAASTATILTGGPLTGREITFDVKGYIDGPSAGAAMTVGAIAAFRGDELRPNVTMTGTINPDGTVGPVGGIPQKLQGALDSAEGEVQAIGTSGGDDGGDDDGDAMTYRPASLVAGGGDDGDGDAVMLIPAGQQTSLDLATGEMVDMLDLGRRNDVEVREVADVYEAYEEFTGVELPRLDERGDTNLDQDTNERIRASVNRWLSRYEASSSERGTLGFDGAELVFETGLAELADDAAAAAERLSDQGLQAGAYSKAQLAAAFAAGAVAVGRGWDLGVAAGLDAWEADLMSRAAVCGEVGAVADTLGTFKPESVSDASGLIAAYTSLVNAVSLCDLAEELLVRPVETEEEFIQDLLVSALYFEIADILILSSEDMLGFTRGLGGTGLDDDVDLVTTADFFRRAAEANLAAFDTIVIDEIASEEGVSTDIVKAAFFENFIEYAFAVNGLNVVHALEEYFGDAETAAYGRLGGSLEVYALTSSLLAQFYSLQAQVTEDLEIVGVAHDRALLNALDLGEDQISGAIVSLRSEDVEAPAVVGAFEAARLDREGDTSEKFDALFRLWSGYVGARMLAYLGGFETAGL